NPEPMIGDHITFTVTVHNAGPNNFENISISENIESGFSLVNVEASHGSYSPVSGIWSIDLLADGETAILALVVEVLGTGIYTNIASITESSPIDSDPENNWWEVTVHPLCLFVYNEFSPNYDGINDHFIITCIENYPDNDLKVFN